MTAKDINRIVADCKTNGKIQEPDLVGALQQALPKFEQIAFYCQDITKAEGLYRNLLGCGPAWIRDTVTAQGYVGPQAGAQGWDKNGYGQRSLTKCVNVAELSFNYGLGIELELIKYVAGNNWHQHKGRLDGSAPFLSHMSYHVDSVATETARLEKMGLRVIQSVETLSHTSEHLVKTGRKYRYVIFDSSDQLGFDVKLIERVGKAK